MCDEMHDYDYERKPEHASLDRTLEEFQCSISGLDDPCHSNLSLYL
jgi:hypothetical protein